MPLFRYRARDKSGALVMGDMEAVSAPELKESLFREGFIPLNVQELKPTGLSLTSFVDYFRRVKHEQLMIFTRQFATLFKAGVSMETILSTMANQFRGGTLHNTLIRIRTDVASGSTLAQAFSRHPRVFNDLYTSMLAAGEEGGILEQVLMNLSQLLEKEFEIRKNVKGATLYPKIIVSVLIGAVSFLMTFVVPKFVGFYSRYDAELPLPTQILITMSGIFLNYWYILIAVALTIYILFRRFSETNVGRLKIDRIRFRLPVFGDLHLKVANARFAYLMASLYGAGLPMTRCLEVVSKVIGNAAYAQEVQKVRDAIQRGETLSQAMSHQRFFPTVVIETTAVGERSGALDQMLLTVASHYDLEVSHTIKNLTTLLEPLLLVGIFGMVTLLALAIFLPIWNLSRVVGGM